MPTQSPYYSCFKNPAATYLLLYDHNKGTVKFVMDIQNTTPASFIVLRIVTKHHFGCLPKKENRGTSCYFLYMLKRIFGNSVAINFIA